MESMDGIVTINIRTIFGGDSRSSLANITDDILTNCSINHNRNVTWKKVGGYYENRSRNR